VRDTAFYNWSSPAMARDVKDWLDNPSGNFGWLIKSDSLKQFDSRQSSRIDIRPVLEVVYQEIQYLTTVDSDLPEPNINQIHFDENTGLFWMAFATKGLGVLDMDTATWRFFTTSDGLPSNSVFAIADVDGVFWVATQNGIARQRTSGSWQAYDSGGGLKADRVRQLYSDDPTRIWLSYIEAGGGLVDPRTAQ
jgi:ligand-binding sensor domain-containing protein